MNEAQTPVETPAASSSPAAKGETASVSYRPRLCYYHASPKGTGSAARFTLNPAQGDSEGCLYATVANQKTVGSRAGGAVVYPSFDWDNAICVKLGLGDLTQILMVLRGMQENVGDGKGLFHQSAKGSTVIRFEHLIEPRCGYMLDVNRNGVGTTEHTYLFLRPHEALGFSLALEQALGFIAFGVPAPMSLPA